MRGRLLIACLLGIGAAAGAPMADSPMAAVAQEPGLACDVASMQAAAPADTMIVSAHWLDQPVRNCRVDGYVRTTHPGPNRNNFRLQLPEKRDWNRRYYFIGVGGSGGSVPTESQIPRGNPLVKGFAVAGTDKGHQTDALDWSFQTDPAKALDNAHRGAHVTTVAAQQLTRAFYGVARMYRYHSGCSGGGDMGVKAIHLHPEDYDGVLLGWPGGTHPDPAKAGPSQNFANMLRAVTREPGAWISPAKRKFVEGKVIAACDMTDGARDDMIWDHRLCRFDFATLACKGADDGQCLTPAEVRTFDQMVRTTQSPISNPSMWSYIGNTPPPWNPSPSRENAARTAAAYVILNGWARTQLGQPDRDILKNPLTREEEVRIDAGQARDGGSVPGGADVRIASFARNGGKAIFFVGVSDPCCSNLALENWFRQTIARAGPAVVDRSARLYQVPGWGHCGGGTGPTDGQDRMLAALIDWVEQDKAPEGIVMHRGADRAQLMFASAGATISGVPIEQPTGPSRDFLVCPYPLVSVFDRSKAGVPGAVWDARNWSCRKSRE
jgi:feruloyl esterase